MANERKNPIVWTRENPSPQVQAINKWLYHYDKKNGCIKKISEGLRPDEFSQGHLIFLQAPDNQTTVLEYTDVKGHEPVGKGSKGGGADSTHYFAIKPTKEIYFTPGTSIPKTPNTLHDLQTNAIAPCESGSFLKRATSEEGVNRVVPAVAVIGPVAGADNKQVGMVLWVHGNFKPVAYYKG